MNVNTKHGSAIYIAAPFDQRGLYHELAKKLQNKGWTVVSSWLWAKDEDPLVEAARRDVFDLKFAHVVVRMPSNGAARHGGRFAEVGMALALGKRVIIVGGHENVFDWLPEVQHVKNEEELLKCL